MSRWRFKFTILTPWTLLPDNLPEHACKDEAADDFADLLCVRTRFELRKFSFWPRARSEAFLCSSFDAFEERFLKHSEYAVIVLSGSHSSCLDAIYPRLLVFFTMRRSWTDRFLLIFLGEPRNPPHFDTKLLTHAPIVFTGKPEENWSQDSESWEKLLGVLQTEYMSGSMEDLKSETYARSRCRIGNRWTSVTDLRGRSYAIKITENATQTNFVPSSWHDLTICGVSVKNTSSSLRSRRDSTPISEPCLVQSQGAYFVPAKRVRTSSANVSNTASPLKCYYSDWSPNFVATSPELLSPSIYSGLSVSAGALNPDVSPSFGRHFSHTAYHDSFRIEETEETDNAALTTENTSAASEQDEMCLPKPSYFKSKKYKTQLTRSERIHKPSTKIKRGLHLGKNRKSKSLGDSLDKPSVFTPMVQRIRSKASEVLRLHPKEDKFGKRSKNTLGDTLVSLANMSTEIVSLYPSTNRVDNAQAMRLSADLQDRIDHTGLKVRGGIPHSLSNDSKPVNDVDVAVHDARLHLLNTVPWVEHSISEEHVRLSDRSEEVTTLINVKNTCSHALPKRMLATVQSCPVVEHAAEKPLAPDYPMTSIASTAPECQPASNLFISGDAVHTGSAPSYVDLPDMQSQLHHMDNALLEVERSMSLEAKSTDIITDSEKTRKNWHSGGTDSSECLTVKENYEDLRTITQTSADAVLATGIRHLGSTALTSDPPERSGNVDEKPTVEGIGAEGATANSLIHSTALMTTGHTAACTDPTDLVLVSETIPVPLIRKPVYGSIPFREQCGLISSSIQPSKLTTETTEAPTLAVVLDEPHLNSNDHNCLQPGSMQLMETSTSLTEQMSAIDDITKELRKEDVVNSDSHSSQQFDTNLEDNSAMCQESRHNMTREQSKASEHESGVHRHVGDGQQELLNPSLKRDENGRDSAGANLVLPSSMALSIFTPSLVIEESPITSSQPTATTEDNPHLQLMNNMTTFNGNVHVPGSTESAGVNTVGFNTDEVRSHCDEIAQLKNEPIASLPINPLYSVGQTKKDIELEPTLCTRSAQPEQVDTNELIPSEKLSTNLVSTMADFSDGNFDSNTTDPVHIQQHSKSSILSSTPPDRQPLCVVPLRLSTGMLVEQTPSLQQHKAGSMPAIVQAQETNHELDAGTSVTDGSNYTVICQPVQSRVPDNQSVIEKNNGNLFHSEPVPYLTSARPHENQGQFPDSQFSAQLTANNHSPGECSSTLLEGNNEIVFDGADHAITPSTSVVESLTGTKETYVGHTAHAIISNTDSESISTNVFEVPVKATKISGSSWFEWWSKILPFSTLLLADELDMHIIDMEASMIMNDNKKIEKGFHLNTVLNEIRDNKNSVDTTPTPNVSKIPSAGESDALAHTDFSWYTWLLEKLSSRRRISVQFQKTVQDDCLSEVCDSPFERTTVKVLSDSSSLDQTSDVKAVYDEEFITPSKQAVVNRLPVEPYEGFDTDSAEQSSKEQMAGTGAWVDSKAPTEDAVRPPSDDNAKEAAAWNPGSAASALYYADRGLHIAICWSLIRNALRNPFCVAAIFVVFTSASSHIRQWPRLLDQLSGISDVYLFTPPSRTDRPGLSYWCQWIDSTRSVLPWRGRATITTFLRYPWSLINPAD